VPYLFSFFLQIFFSSSSVPLRLVFLSLMQEFTPIFDEVCQHTGLIPAAVYGVVWRCCQMSDHVCYASLETIGLQAGVSKRTVIRALVVLEEQAWIVDLTPTYRNASHVYQVTQRLAPSQPAPANPTPPACPSPLADKPPRGSDSPSPHAVPDSQPALPDSQPAVTPGHPRSDSLSSPAVTHSHLNQTLPRDSSRNESEIDQAEEEEEEEVDIPEWRLVLQMLELQLNGRSQYASWFPALRPLSFDGAVLLVAAPDAYQATLLNARLAHTASTILSGTLGRAGMLVTFVAEESRQS
jgi:hypothetical protein